MPTTLLALEYIPRGDTNNWDIREDANKDKIDLILGTQHNVTTGAHDNITPETASTGSIGSLAKPYANLYVDAVPTPTQAVQPANKEYVDSVVNGLDWQNSVLSKTLTTPPGSPIQGDRYIIAVGATGAWAGQDNNVTEYNGTSWDFFTVNKGFATWVEAENVNYTWNGTAWVKFGSTVTHANLIGLSADDHPQYYNQARGDARYLQLAGGTMLAPLGIATGSSGGLSFESGKHWFTTNDGNGNFNLRIAHDPAELCTEAGYAFHMEYAQSAGDWQFNISNASLAVNDPITWIKVLNINTTGTQVTGNIAVTGTVDGRDVAADGTKLDGIEAGATADQTDAEIKTAYENNADTNAFTDAEKNKLSAIEAGATADQIASEVPNTPAGNIAATDVQAAINELDTEKAALTGAGQTLSDTHLIDISEAVNAIGNTTANTNVDFSLGHLQTMTLAVATTTLAFINPPASGRCGSMTLEIHQDATGSRFITWPTSVKWAGGTVPTLSAGANAVDIFTFYTSDGGTTWYGFEAGIGMA